MPLITRNRLALAVVLGTAALPAAATGLSGAYLAATQADFRDDYAGLSAFAK